MEAARGQLELRGPKTSGRVLGALLVLEGASKDALRRASAFASMLAERCLLVAVDGGLRTCRAARRRPDLFVGEADSFKGPPAEVPSVLLDPDDDASDLSGALREMRARKVQVVVLAGLLGGRLDHEWANLLELGRQSRAFSGIVAQTDRGTVVVTSHGCSLATVRGRTFSLLSLRPSSTVTLHGTKSELERVRIRPGSNGLSNLTGTRLELTVHAGAVALVLLPPRRARTRAAARAAPVRG